jgi:hypothetical protein
MRAGHEESERKTDARTQNVLKLYDNNICNVYNKNPEVQRTGKRRCLQPGGTRFFRSTSFTSMSDPSGSSNARPLRSDRAVRRGPAVRFLADGAAFDAFEGESVAAALLAAGCRELRRSPRADAPRGMFCLMGSCQECLVWVGSRKLPSCQVPVAEGLVVESLGFRERRLGG